MKSPRTRWFGLFFISLSVAMIIVDATIVNVAIPTIVDDLGITSTQVQWVQESYTLVFAALLLVFGSLADRHGRKRLLILGIVVFGAASVFAALAPNGELLILARVIQGVGGAMVLPTTLSIINTGFVGRERGIAFAIWGATIGGTVALGPLLGGWLTEFYSWRWAFGINIPLGLIIMVGLMMTISDSADQRSPNRVDIGGALISVIASGSLVFGLIEGRTYGWWQTKPDNPFSVGGWEWPLGISLVPIAFLISALAVTLFVVRARRRGRLGKPSLLSLSLFRIPSFRNGNVAALIVSLGEFGILLAIPLWLQNVAGYGALETGFVLLALAGGSFAASGISSGLLKTMSPLAIVRVGLLLEVGGILALAVGLTAESTWAFLVPCLFVYGLGVGLATAQLTGVILHDVPKELSGQGSGTQSTARQIGSALGIAILGTVLFTASSAAFAASLDRDFSNIPADTRSQLVTTLDRSAGAAIPGITGQDPAVGAAAAEAFSSGTKWSAYIGAGFLAIGFAATFNLRPQRSPEETVASARRGGSEKT
ncbi:MFS transporter [Flaviflexus huanghaiensis]|uniref:MFS transporter n=1 Tax=Flaviflexus huanghaiensis TaxID=1111473 RepID=UPI0015F94224|nr:MFS transporter [Flaviflexus huanghaiensis]